LARRSCVVASPSLPPNLTRGCRLRQGERYLELAAETEDGVGKHIGERYLAMAEPEPEPEPPAVPSEAGGAWPHDTAFVFSSNAGAWFRLRRAEPAEGESALEYYTRLRGLRPGTSDAQTWRSIDAYDAGASTLPGFSSTTLVSPVKADGGSGFGVDGARQTSEVVSPSRRRQRSSSPGRSPPRFAEQREADALEEEVERERLSDAIAAPPLVSAPPVPADDLQPEPEPEPESVLVPEEAAAESAEAVQAALLEKLEAAQRSGDDAELAAVLAQLNQPLLAARSPSTADPSTPQPPLPDATLGSVDTAKSWWRVLERQKLDSRALRGGELMLHLVLIKHGWDKSVTLRFILPEAEGEACAAYVDEIIAQNMAEEDVSRQRIADIRFWVAFFSALSLLTGAAVAAAAALLLCRRLGRRARRIALHLRPRDNAAAVLGRAQARDCRLGTQQRRRRRGAPAPTRRNDQPP